MSDLFPAPPTDELPPHLVGVQHPSAELDIPRHFSLVSMAAAILTVGIMVLLKVPAPPAIGWIILGVGLLAGVYVIVRSIRYIRRGGDQRRTGILAIPVLLVTPLLAWLVLTFATQ